MNTTRIVRVLPDGPIDKAFDYLVPDELGDQVRVGTMVRVELHGRRVGAWVVEDPVDPPPGVTLKPIAKVTGWGPPAELVDLAGWASWRWAGRRASFLGTASPERAVVGLPPPSPPPPTTVIDDLGRQAFSRPRSLVRLPPAADTYPLALAAASRGNALILTPSLAAAQHLVLRLKRAGVPVVLAGRGWAQGLAGATVVGARAAAWAPVGDLAGVLVLDEHDEGYAEERAPTWNARDVAIERARRAGVPCVLVSPSPSLEALTWGGDLLIPSRSAERAGWPILDVVDQRREDPRTGLYSERLVRMLRSAASVTERGQGRVVCVLNRKGRVKLLACGACNELARCERCEAAVEQVEREGGPPELRCLRCGAERPPVCLACGGGRFKALRLGVSRVRDDLERLAGVRVVEVTGDADDLPEDASVYIGTEAVLHRVDAVDGVAFLDIDQELLAPRYRAAEQATALLVRAARLVGGRRTGGRVLVQTRLPKHEVIDAALHGDPGRLAAVELERRKALSFPPCSALAEVSGAAAAAFVDGLGRPLGVDVLGPTDGRWLLRAADHRVLCDALAAAKRPPGRLRVEVDPVRL